MDLKGFTMTAIHNSNQDSQENTHIANYKKSLLAIFDKKKIWKYLNEERAKKQRNKKQM